MKTIGVLGGLGPQATMDFEARVHRISQQLIPQRMNSGYPPMIVYYYRHPPILLNADGTSILPMQPDPRLPEAAKNLGPLVDFLVITSNTPHMFQAEIEQASGRKVLSMIQVTLDEVMCRHYKKVGVLGFRDPVFYTKPLAEMHVSCETIDGTLRSRLDTAIMHVMEGRNSTRSTDAAKHAVAELLSRSVDCIILGCTEIPLLLQYTPDEPNLVNPMQLLAEAAVRYAIA
jgi:aspartate racemase